MGQAITMCNCQWTKLWQWCTSNGNDQDNFFRSISCFTISNGRRIMGIFLCYTIPLWPKNNGVNCMFFKWWNLSRKWCKLVPKFMKHFLYQHISLMTNILKFIEFKESATLVFEYITQQNLHFSSATFIL